MGLVEAIFLDTERDVILPQLFLKQTLWMSLWYECGLRGDDKKVLHLRLWKLCYYISHDNLLRICLWIILRGSSLRKMAWTVTLCCLVQCLTVWKVFWKLNDSIFIPLPQELVEWRTRPLYLILNMFSDNLSY